MRKSVEDSAADQFDQVIGPEQKANYGQSTRCAKGQALFTGIVSDLGRAKAESSVPIVERFWQLASNTLTDFDVPPISPHAPVMLQLCLHVARFLERRAWDAVHSMSTSSIEDIRALTYNASILEVTHGQHIPPVIYLNDFTNDGVDVAMSIIGNGVDAFMYHDGRDEEDISMDEVQTFLKSPEFRDIVEKMAYSSAEAENAFLDTLTMATDSCEDVHYYVFTMDAFELVESATGNKYLKIRPAFLDAMKEQYVREIAKRKGDVNQCPAAYTKGKKDTVLREFVQWLISLTIEHYVPNRYPNLGKNVDKGAGDSFDDY